MIGDSRVLIAPGLLDEIPARLEACGFKPAALAPCFWMVGLVGGLQEGGVLEAFVGPMSLQRLYANLC